MFLTPGNLRHIEEKYFLCNILLKLLDTELTFDAVFLPCYLGSVAKEMAGKWGGVKV